MKYFYTLLFVIIIVACKRGNHESEPNHINNDYKIESNNQKGKCILNPVLQKTILHFLSEENCFYTVCEEIEGEEHVIDTLIKTLSITFFKAADSNYFIITLSALPCDAIQFFYSSTILPKVLCNNIVDCDINNPAINKKMFIYDYDNTESHFLYLANKSNDKIVKSETLRLVKKLEYAIDDSFKYQTFRYSVSNDIIIINPVPLPKEQ